MGSKREDVELELLLRDPKVAKEWVQKFNWDIEHPPKYIVAGLDQRIYLDRMTDREAVLAAFLILRDIEIPRVSRELQYVRYTH